MGLVIVTEPEIEPITLDDIKNDLKVDIDLVEDDYLIRGFVKAARRWVEKIGALALITQTLNYTLDAWPEGDTIKLPRWPVQSVSSIKYYDTASSENTLSSAAYFVDTIGQPARVVLNSDQSWPSTTLRPANGVILEFVAGFGDTEDEIPETLKHGIRLLVSHWYENRGAVATSGGVPKVIPFGVEALLWPERVF